MKNRAGRLSMGQGGNKLVAGLIAALSEGDLFGGGIVVQQDLNDVVVFHLQLRDGFVQGPRHFVEAEYCVLGGQDAVGVVTNGLPGCLHVAVLCNLARGQAGFRIAVNYIAPQLFELVTGTSQCVER